MSIRRLAVESSCRVKCEMKDAVLSKKDDVGFERRVRLRCVSLQVADDGALHGIRRSPFRVLYSIFI